MDQDYVIGAPGPVLGATFHTCVSCRVPVWLSEDGEAIHAAGALPLCLRCGIAQAAAEGEPIQFLPYRPPRAQ